MNNILDELILTKKRMAYKALITRLEHLEYMAGMYVAGMKLNGKKVSNADVTTERYLVLDEIWKAMWISEETRQKYKE